MEPDQDLQAAALSVSGVCLQHLTLGSFFLAFVHRLYTAVEHTMQ